MPMPKITPAQARLALKRADIEEQIKALEAGAPFKSLGVQKSREEAIADHQGRIALCDELMELDDDGLNNRAVGLVKKLTAHHVTCWACEMVGLQLPSEDQTAAWGDGDYETRMELDLILIAQGKRP